MERSGVELEDLLPGDSWMYIAPDDYMYNQILANYLADCEESKKRAAEEISQDETELPDDAEPRSVKRAKITELPEDDTNKGDEPSEEIFGPRMTKEELMYLERAMQDWTHGEFKLLEELLRETTSQEEASCQVVTTEVTASQGGTSSEDNSSEDTIPEETSREDAWQDNTSPQDAFQDNTSPEDAFQDNTSLEDPSRANASKENASQESPSPEDASQDNTISNTSKEVVSPKPTTDDETTEEGIAQLKFEEDVRISQTWKANGYPPFFNCRFGGDCPHIFTKNVRSSELRDHFQGAHADIYVREGLSVKCCWKGCEGKGKQFVQHTVLRRHLEPPRRGHKGMHLDVDYDHEEMNKCVEKIRLAREKAWNPYGAS